MTYAMIVERVKLDSGVILPQSTDSDARKLGWISEAMCKYQAVTHVMRESTRFSISQYNTTGKYQLDIQMSGITRAVFNANLDSPPTNTPILVLSMEAFEQRCRLIEHGDMYNDVKFIGVDDLCAVHVYPKNVDGYITLDYTLALTQYDPMNTTEWAGFGKDPTKRMAVVGPPKRFNNVIDGLIAYAKIQLVMSKNSDVNMWRTQIAYWNKQFEDGYNILAENRANYTKNTLTRPKLGLTK